MAKQNTLNISNLEQITYTTEELGFTILGGIKLEGLDRLRVTMKIEVINRKFNHYLNNPEIADLALRHNLDLYNDTQTEKLIRKTAEKLEVGTSSVAKAVADITDQLETYRLRQIEKQTVKAETSIKLTPEQQQAATDFLKQPNLLDITNDMIGQSGVVGEEYNRLLMYLIFTSRKRQRPLHIVSLGSSGIGKTYLQEKVGELIPEEDKLEITVLSENAFYYFGQRELSHKLILIEDLDGLSATGGNNGSGGAFYALRELQSKKRISKTVAHKDTRGNTKTVHLTVEGPVSVAGCTTRESIYEDNANRSFLIYIDESPEQDERIMEYQRKVSAGKINTEEEAGAASLLKNCQRVLQPITIRNPYAEHLKIPQEVFKPRRTNNHYLAFIEAITFYHQYQREQKADEQTGEVYIETTLEDIAAANKLMKEILLRKSDELTGACRNYFERLKKWLHEEKKTAFTNAQARIALREKHSSQKHYMVSLQQNGLIRKTTGDKKKGFYYEVVSMEEYEQLRQGITNVLDKIFLELSEEMRSYQEVKTGDEPHNAQNTSEESEKLTDTPKEVSEEEKPQSQGAEYTYRKLLSGNHSDQVFTPEMVSRLTGKSKRTESRYLKELSEAGLLERFWQDKKYKYKLKP